MEEAGSVLNRPPRPIGISSFVVPRSFDELPVVNSVAVEILSRFKSVVEDEEGLDSEGLFFCCTGTKGGRATTGPPIAKVRTNCLAGGPWIAQKTRKRNSRTRALGLANRVGFHSIEEQHRPPELVNRTHLRLAKDTPSERPVEPKPDGAELGSLARLGGLHRRYVWKTAA